MWVIRASSGLGLAQRGPDISLLEMSLSHPRRHGARGRTGGRHGGTGGPPPVRNPPTTSANLWPHRVAPVPPRSMPNTMRPCSMPAGRPLHVQSRVASFWVVFRTSIIARVWYAQATYCARHGPHQLSPQCPRLLAHTHTPHATHAHMPLAVSGTTAVGREAAASGGLGGSHWPGGIVGRPTAQAVRL